MVVKLKGFTLIELLIGLSVLTLLFLITVSSLDFIKKNEKQVIVDELVTVINYAKTHALSSGRAMYLKPLDKQGNWIHGVQISFNTDLTDDELIYQWGWHHPRWILHWQGLNENNAIRFSYEAISAISNGHFTLEQIDTREQTVITLNRLGRIKMNESA